VTRNDAERIGEHRRGRLDSRRHRRRRRTPLARRGIRRLAAERLLEIIGEAARAMSEESRARYPEIAWADIIGLRTILAHHYHRVDPDQVWVIASDEVPKLLAALEDS
jgi:uncharacterized protein with HEPN domain